MPAALWLNTTGERSRKESDNGKVQQDIIWDKRFAFRLYSGCSVCPGALKSCSSDFGTHNSTIFRITKNIGNMCPAIAITKWSDAQLFRYSRVSGELNKFEGAPAVPRNQSSLFLH